MTSISNKPYARWWWFCGAIEESVVRYQLDWLKTKNFGGVEIAWVYALPDGRPGPEWLSDEWTRIVVYAKEYAERVGLGCDFTFSTAWPFGGSIIESRDASRNFKGLSNQRLEKSWDCAADSPLYILNHLDHNALHRYARRIGSALKPALKGNVSGLFCDSWEVETDGVWSDGFDKIFNEQFGYDITPYQANLDSHPDVRYDYRKLISDRIIQEFYKPFTEICHELGAFSRVQCHGSPTDLITAYSEADIPESEVLLFDPHFSQIAASSAILSGKKIVSAEAFSCLYGWKPYPGPGPYQKQELITDLKIVADSLFANGVNFLVWHGAPYNPPGGKNQFYASVYVGEDANFADRLEAFNEYIGRASEMMRNGQPYGDIAVYMPIEDNWMLGKLPDDMLRPSARYYWELQYQRFPLELVGHRPIWVNNHFLKNAHYDGKYLHCGTGDFLALYVDSKWLDHDALASILRLAGQGLPICIKQKPSMPGHKRKSGFEKDRQKLLEQANVHGLLSKTVLQAPLIQTRGAMDYWCRRDNDDLVIFLAHPGSRNIMYPLHYGQSFCAEVIESDIILNWQGNRTEVRLEFTPYQSLSLRIDKKGRTEIFKMDFDI